jgi:hypothetical protein
MSARRQAVVRPPRLGAPYVGMLSGILVVVAAFLPWYATNVGPPFSPESVAGWEATNLARASVGMGIVVAVASVVAAIDAQGGLRLDPSVGDAVAWVVIAASAVAAVLVGYRLLVMPEPAEFLSRQIGVYLAAAGAVGGILSGLALVATRS